MTKDVFSGEDTISTALQLIRYDIPVLILGKSSIGKSFTLIDITKKWHISNQLLYVGSEKSENIEGVPKLTDRKKGKDVLEYLQPFWFPNAAVITKSVANGRKLFDKFVKDFWKLSDNEAFSVNYINLNSMLNALSSISWQSEDLDKEDGIYRKNVTLTDFQWVSMSGDKTRVLNMSLFPLEKHPYSSRKEDGIASENAIIDEYNRDDLKDFCAYLTTCLGYGNYWLILDEIDKVEEMDKDKFAPLLHIVRERTLKNFRMIDINSGKGIGIPLGKTFINTGYEGIVNQVNAQLEAKESVLDTRVIAIANKTKNIEEALFRRFSQLIAEEVMIWRPDDLMKEENKVEECLRGVKNEMVSAGIESGSLTLGLKFQKLDEINLQWQYNFLPKMLNNTDMHGNFFRTNALNIHTDTEDAQLDWLDERKFSAFYKVLDDNFRKIKTQGGGEFSLPDKLFSCLEHQLIDMRQGVGVVKKSHEEEIKGIRGILADKEKELGDHYSIALDIVNKLREAYPSSVKRDIDKLNLLYNWTDSVIEYLRAAIFSSPTKVTPLNLSKHLIPMLVNVFYTEVAKDKENLSDNIVAITERFQAFFTEVYEISPSFNIDCDKNTTTEVFYGGAKSELDVLDEQERKTVSETSFFGTDEKNWIHSASGKLSMMQMEEGLTLSIPILVKEKGFEDTAEIFINEPKAVAFMNRYFQEQLLEIIETFKNHVKELKVADNKEAAIVFYNAQQIAEGILEETV